MTHDDELIDRLVTQSYKIAQARQVHGTSIDVKVFKVRHADLWKRTCEDAIAFLATVRAYDAERRASILDAAAAAIPDPDDYRDLPLSMTADVRFRGGLTEGKS